MFKYNKEISFSSESRTSHSMIASMISEGETVLELGCAKGELCAYIKSTLGCTTYGIDISEEAIEAAKAHLDGFICCDIENYDWESELSTVKFDTLVFADVLEHLREPAKAIRRALSLLKDDGKILFSVPNIAHADIILKLIGNRFDYTDIGLLDNTHIHFFARQSLVPFCEEAGIFPILIDATVCPAGSSEQSFDEANPLARAIVSSSGAHEAYQFVVCALKADIAVESGAKTIWQIPEISKTATVFFDTGSGFKTDEAIFTECDDGDFEITVRVPLGAVLARVDLREGEGFTVENLICTQGDAVLSLVSTNNISRLGERYYLFQADSQFVFKCEGAGDSLTVKGTISNMTTHSSPLFELSSTIEDIGLKLDATENELSLSKNHISNLDSLILARDEHITNLTGALDELRAHADFVGTQLDRANRDIALLDAQLSELRAELDHYKTHYFVAISQREDLKRQLADVTHKYEVISNAGWWKITKPFRVLFDIIKYPFRHGPILKVRKFFKVWREQGFKSAWRKVFKKSKNKKANAPLFTPAELVAQRSTKFERDIKFSVIVPLYNTPEEYLKAMIESVLAQTYSNWELCLADGSDGEHAYVERVVQKYARKDSRILYTKLEKNLGISGNTNACLEMSTGDYITLFDHDDLLHESALFCVMKEICENGADFIYTDENTFHKTPADAYHPHFKPDFSPDTLRSYNYICHLTTFSRGLYEQVGGFRSEFDGSQDYDMILRLTEKAQKIVHIPKILYYWRCHKASVASDISAKPYTLVAAKKALNEHLKRLGLKGEALDSRIPSVYQIKYDIVGEPLVSIIIANKDYIDDLDKCITSIIEKSTYKNYEIIVVENNSTDPKTFKYYDEVTEKHPQVKVIYWEGQGFNYSKINNYGFECAKGEHIILLNNDIEILTPDWIEQMLMFSQRGDVGAVGAMLYYPDDTIQHAGVIIGIGADPEMAVAGHSHKYFKRGDYGYASRLALAQNLSAVTAACVMIRRDVYEAVGGLDESFAVAFNDVDLCLKIRKAGYLIVWTPFAEAYHYESKSRGLETTPEKVERFNGEINNFLRKWRSVRDAGDPYYNPNLTLEREDFSL